MAFSQASQLVFGFEIPQGGIMEGWEESGVVSSGTGRLIFRQEPFEEKSGDEPTGSIVQTDDFAQVPSGAAVVPWAQVTAAQPQAGCIFSGKNHAGVDQSAEYEITAAHQARQGS